MTDLITPKLAAALDYRTSLIASLEAEHTNAYRLFHGATEGEPGVTVDRYGDLVLIQSFHRPLDAATVDEITRFYASAMPEAVAVYNDRSAPNSRIINELAPAELALAQTPRTVSELGVQYRFQARHAGQDPWLFLDLRAGRRRVMAECAGKSVLNLFAYTCGVGVAAAKAGAQFVVNVDFSESSLAVGKENARLNELPIRLRLIKSDAFAAMRQFAGIGQPRIVRGKRMPPFPQLEPRKFDLVFLDPPRYAKSAFGVVDLVNDYAALFKPALLCTHEGGTIVCCNNVAGVSRENWLDQLSRSAHKAGRAIRGVEWIDPEGDFPSPDDEAPLKMVMLRV